MFARAFWLQGVQAAHLSALAQSQHESTQKIPAGRGTIFDRTGVQLAIGEQKTTIYADPQQVRNARAIALAAHEILGVDANALYPQLLDKKKQFVYVQRFADPEKAKLFLKKGFARRARPTRRSCGPTRRRGVAAQVLGYAGVENHGLGGLELQYDRKLAGRAGNADDRARSDGPGDRRDQLAARAGGRRRLHRRSTTRSRRRPRRCCARRSSKWGAKDATASSSTPRPARCWRWRRRRATTRTTPSNVARYAPGLLRNRAVTDTYEPGSTFKLVTITAALSEHIVTPSTRFTLPYLFRYGSCWQCTVHDAELARDGRTTRSRRSSSYSSNVGAVTIAEKLGPQRLADWVKKFGFGSTHGHRLPRREPRVRAAARPVERHDDRQRADRAGHLGDADPDGVRVRRGRERRRLDPAAPRRARRRPRAREVAQAAADVARRRPRGQVDAHRRRRRRRARPAPRPQIPGYTVAGKTGTAQVPTPHGYSTTDYTASFVGMVPASHPRLVVLVKVDDPRGSIFGGVVAAPAFASIAKFDLQYLEVPPGRAEDPHQRQHGVASAGGSQHGVASSG